MARKAVLETMGAHLAPKDENPQGYGAAYLRYLAGEAELPRPNNYGLSGERAIEVQKAWDLFILRAATTITARTATAVERGINTIDRKKRK